MARILIIDDYAGLRSVMHNALKAGGHEVFEAANGKSGLALYRRDRHDLVLCEILVPDADGFEVIRSLVHEYPHVKIVAMTGGSPKIKMDLLPIAEKLGAVQTLYKPFSPVLLLRVVTEVLAAAPDARLGQESPVGRSPAPVGSAATET